MSQSNSDNLLIRVSMYLNTLFSIVAADYNITIFPTAILHESGINGYKIYQKSDLKVETNVTKSAERVKQWIFERLEENDRIVVKAITAEAFKSSPDDFKHVSHSSPGQGLLKCFSAHGYIKTPNTNFVFLLQSMPYDVKIGPH